MPFMADISMRKMSGNEKMLPNKTKFIFIAVNEYE